MEEDVVVAHILIDFTERAEVKDEEPRGSTA
jgi:hypothetical protein